MKPIFEEDGPHSEDNWNPPKSAEAIGTATHERQAILNWLHSNLGNEVGSPQLEFMGKIIAIISNGIERGEHLK